MRLDKRSLFLITIFSIAGLDSLPLDAGNYPALKPICPRLEGNIMKCTPPGGGICADKDKTCDQAAAEKGFDIQSACLETEVFRLCDGYPQASRKSCHGETCCPYCPPEDPGRCKDDPPYPYQGNCGQRCSVVGTKEPQDGDCGAGVVWDTSKCDRVDVEGTCGGKTAKDCRGKKDPAKDCPTYDDYEPQTCTLSHFEGSKGSCGSRGCNCPPPNGQDDKDQPPCKCVECGWDGNDCKQTNDGNSGGCSATGGSSPRDECSCRGVSDDNCHGDCYKVVPKKQDFDCEKGCHHPNVSVPSPLCS